MKHLVSYQREVDKGKLTAVASFEKLTFRAIEPFVGAKCDKGLSPKRQLFKTRYGSNFPLSTSR